MSRRATWALLALLASGCAENAVLELQVELPPAPTGEPWFAQVQVRRAAGNGFDAVWMGSDPRAVELTSAPQWDCISVQTNDDTVDVNVRVRFCHEIDCLGFGDDTAPERRYFLQTPFYIGRRTYWATTIDAVPQCTSDSDCEVGACVAGQCGCATDADCCPSGGCNCPDEPCYACEAGGCVERIDRCSIEGCVADGRPSSFCTEDGHHFCESFPYDRREAFMCSLP